jgi:tripartite-type tricarboxylate transporter receptor subunit TctC
VRPIFAALALFGFLAAAHAQGTSQSDAAGYPLRPIRLVVPSSPGGGTDIVGRLLAQKLGEVLGQPLVVDNRPGAGTLIGTEFVAKSAPDGYTLLMGLSTLAIDPSIYAKLPYDALKDFAAISLAASVPNVLSVHPSVPATTVPELIALASARQGRLTCGSAGLGTNPHLAAELFRTMAGVEWVHVPYKGSGPAVIGLLAGQVDLMFATLPSVIQHVRAGKLRALGVSTAARAPALPDVPTIAEAGLPGYEAIQWYGVLAPTGTPRAIIDRLSRDIGRALQAPEMRERLAVEGATPIGSSPDEFAAYLRRETEKWAEVIKTTGLKPE